MPSNLRIYTKIEVDENITELRLPAAFTGVLDQGSIPNHIKKLYLGFNSKIALKKGAIPESVTHLFMETYDAHLEKGIIPNSVTYLHMGDRYNSRLNEGVIPNSVTHLIFGYSFNQPLKKGDIPDSVTFLKFGYNFRKYLTKDYIPESVKILVFDDNYKCHLDKSNLPENLQYLFLGYKCSSYVDANCQIVLLNKLEEHFQKDIKIKNLDDYHLRDGSECTEIAKLIEDHKLFAYSFCVITKKENLVNIKEMEENVIKTLKQQLVSGSTIDLRFDLTYQTVMDQVCQRVNDNIGEKVLSASIIKNQVVFQLV